MKTAGNVLSALFDRQFVEKAQGYSKLFDSWVEITAKNGIAAAAAHSRIKDLDRGILLVEIDHPGWKQILQTKQTKLLNDFRRRFPEQDISAISLMLGNMEPVQDDSEESTENFSQSRIFGSTPPREDAEEEGKGDKPDVFSTSSPAKGLDAIEDEDFKAMLKSLGQSVADREGSE
jgi:hypothetical protein